MLYLMTDNVFGEPYLLMHSKNLKGNINKAEWVGSSSEKQWFQLMKYNSYLHSMLLFNLTEMNVTVILNYHCID